LSSTFASLSVEDLSPVALPNTANSNFSEVDELSDVSTAYKISTRCVADNEIFQAEEEPLLNDFNDTPLDFVDCILQYIEKINANSICVPYTNVNTNIVSLLTNCGYSVEAFEGSSVESTLEYLADFISTHEDTVIIVHPPTTIDRSYLFGQLLALGVPFIILLPTLEALHDSFNISLLRMNDCYIHILPIKVGHEESLRVDCVSWIFGNMPADFSNNYNQLLL
jgi:hypothetical protein